MIELCCEYLSVWCICVYVIIMLCTSFRVNLHSIVCLNVNELLSQSRRHICFFCFCTIYFFYVGFLSVRIHNSQDNRGSGWLIVTPLCFFHPVHKYLHMRKAITAESSHLQLASEWAPTGDTWFPNANCYPLNECKSFKNVFRTLGQKCFIVILIYG